MEEEIKINNSLNQKNINKNENINNVVSIYIKKRIFSFLDEKIKFKILVCNKKLKENLDITI